MISGAESVESAVVIAIDESWKAKAIAWQLFEKIASLENDIEESKKQADEIEDRGFLKRVVSNSNRDLVAVAKNQNKINGQMMGLIQETIRLNMLSYAGLVSLMEEMRRGIEGGLVDANGHIIQLGSEGRDLAEAATDIISGILDASKGTQVRIEKNAKDIAQIIQRLKSKDELDAGQDEAIALLGQRLEDKGSLDAEQTANIQELLGLSKEKQAAIDDLSGRMKIEQAKIDEHRDRLKKLIAQAAMLDKNLHKVESDLQQHQRDAIGELGRLERSHRNWRWVTVALILIPTTWLLIITWHGLHTQGW